MMRNVAVICYRAHLLLLLFSFLPDGTSALSDLATRISTVKNLRAVVPSQIFYRSATLDQLSHPDAELLLRDCSVIIDLRNSDEILKGAKKRTAGATYLYDTMKETTGSTTTPRWVHAPLLKDVDAFWNTAIDRMDASARLAATLQTVFQGGALDRAAARHLEQGGCSMLYTNMMETAKLRIGRVLQECLPQAVSSGEEERGGIVLFHCQKGKDRTGVIGMLLQHCLDESDESIIESYSLSGELLGGEERKDAKIVKPKQDSGEGTGMIDWRYFRGSPPEAMRETLQWTRANFGSIDNYLNATGFGPEQRDKLRQQKSDSRSGLHIRRGD